MEIAAAIFEVFEVAVPQSGETTGRGTTSAQTEPLLGLYRLCSKPDRLYCQTWQIDGCDSFLHADKVGAAGLGSM